MQQPLSGIRLLELGGGIAAAYAAKLFADFGADVVKIEPPDGDEIRWKGPFPPGAHDPELGADHLHLDTNKRSVVLDLPSPAAVADLRRLIGRADVLLESLPPGELARWGLDAETLHRLRPGLVTTSVTPFGQDGPYATYRGEEIVYYAMGGPMHATGVEEREPVKLGADIIQHQGGNVAALATLGALTLAEQRGEAVTVDVSLFEAQAGSVDRRTLLLVNYAYTGRNWEREGTDRLTPAPLGVYPTADGYVQIITIPAWVERMLATVDDPELRAIYEAPDWMADPDTPARSDAVLYPWLMERTKREVTDAAQANRWAITPINQPRELLDDPHFAERGFFRALDHPAAGPIRLPGPPLRMETGWCLRRPAPRVGEHTEEVLHEAAVTDADADDDPAPSPPPPPRGERDAGGSLPLAGVTVIDLTVVWAGPWCTMLLSDLGATVIRVDNPWLFPSSTRGLTPRPPQGALGAMGLLGAAYPDSDPGARPWNRHAMFNAHARNKLGATLDLRKPRGRDAFLRLVERADVLVENNAARTLEGLGLGWDALVERNPELVLLRMPPMGLAGPYRDYLGFGAHFEALSGLTAIRGYADADPSTTTPTYHMDPASGAVGAFAVLMALRRRAETGRGEHIELPQAENLVQHIGGLAVDASRTGRDYPPLGNRHPHRAPQGCYRCAGTDRWVVLSVGSDAEWAGLRRAMGDPPWAAEQRFASAEGRRRHHDEIDAHLGAWCGALDAAEVFHRCQVESVPAGPVWDDAACSADPHLRARGFFRPNGNADAGTHDYPGHLWHWSGPPLRWDPLVRFGADNEHVFRDVAGLDDAEYQALVDDGHIALDYLGPDGRPL